MPLRTDLIQIGSRVSYEDMANPRKTGTVVEFIELGGTTPSGYALPTGTEYRVQWDEGEGETVSDLRQHGWYQLAQLADDNPFNDAEIISVYTMEDAIDDGQLVPALDLVTDEPEFVKQAGWAVPVILTTAVANIIIPTDREANDRYQDVKGRLWDLLRMAATYGARKDTNEILFPCIFQLAGPDRVSAGLIKRSAVAKTLVFKAVIGPSTDGSPVCTIMLRDES